MSLCILCHDNIRAKIGWNAFFYKTEQEIWICDSCNNKLERITGQTCEVCDRPLRLLPQEFVQEGICYDCFRWEQDPYWASVLTKNKSVFMYNEFLKELISLYKFRGDHAVVKIFQYPVVTLLKQIEKYDLITPIPLSPKRLYERGFNQAEEIAKLLNRPIHPLMVRTDSEKQSKKSRRERLATSETFSMVDKSDIHGKSVLLIDDIYTTGTTLRMAAKLLKQEGATVINSLTIARS